MNPLDKDEQLSLDEITPVKNWDEKAVQRALDELFSFTRQYKSSQAYKDLINFIARFRFYSPYNAMLIHIQMPGAKFVAPANRWVRKFGRKIKPAAHPLLILQPMGPVMFVFDVADTEPGPNARPLPPEVENPFGVRNGQIGKELDQTIDNAKRDGLRIILRREGSQSAGSICVVNDRNLPKLEFYMGRDKKGNPNIIPIPFRYSLLLNENLDSESRYATLVHELAHLYCGHLRTPNKKWWPDRHGLPETVREFESESVSYIICKRLGIKTPSDEYLSNYIKDNEEIPPISPDRIMRVAGLIEEMGNKHLKPRQKE